MAVGDRIRRLDVRKPIKSLLESIKVTIDAGAAVKFGSWVVITPAPSRLPAPIIGTIITADYMALIHSSWRYPKMDIKFGMPMWAFHVVVQARDEVLDRIESVTYFLDPSYPSPIQRVLDRPSRFKLKELANGESTLRCDVKIKGQAELITLERYINLTNTGPRI